MLPKVLSLLPNVLYLLPMVNIKMIEAAQIRAARALLGVNQVKLSEWAAISVGTVKRIEGTSEIRGAAETLWKIQRALEQAGVEFIGADETKGPGVRLKLNIRTTSKKGGKRSKAK
jgi:hypothetical protein